jgi:hypothetical protein
LYFLYIKSKPRRIYQYICVCNVYFFRAYHSFRVPALS